MLEKYTPKLEEFAKIVREEVSVIQNGGKLSAFKREIKPREVQLKEQLKGIIGQIAKNGEISEEMWPLVKNYLVIYIKNLLDQFNSKWTDSTSFEEEQQIILQYLAFFNKPPFTLQRITQLTLEPTKYYRSTKKILYAYEKLVNVSEPEQK